MTIKSIVQASIDMNGKLHVNYSYLLGILSLLISCYLVSTTIFNKLSNDFIAGTVISISQTGCTASGAIYSDAGTGEIGYLPTSTEAITGGTVTVVNEVFQTLPDQDICASALAMYSDGDGVIYTQETADGTDINDTFTTQFGSVTILNKLIHDDFIIKTVTRITQIGGTAMGLVNFDSSTGEIC